MSETIVKKNNFHKKEDKFINFFEERININIFKNSNINNTIEQKISGRIKKIRTFGNLTFMDINDDSGNLQLKFIGDDNDKQKINSINIGDIIGVSGYSCETSSKEKTLKVNNFFLMAKCLKYIPSDYYGLKNIEERFRKRYLDFIINTEKKNIIKDRSKIIKMIRNFLDEKNFIEIETPILVSESSGAEAKPFLTYHNKLRKNFFLRIATEISLKKILIGGFEKIYEIGRVFRNEGIDGRHNPEFTTIEIYHAYQNMDYMMKLTEEIFKNISTKLEKEKLLFNNNEIEILNKWEKKTMIESINEKTGINFENFNELDEYLEIAKKFNISLENFQKNKGHVILAFFEKFVEKELIQPTFIYDYPINISPLSKRKKNNEDLAERFELYIGGIEFANGYTELNDPKEQKERFFEQIKQRELGKSEIIDIDEEFIEALEYGMPPAGGLGIGIDRVIMLFTNTDSIKEVMTFPQLKNK